MFKIFFSIHKKLRYLLVGGFNTLFGLALFSGVYYLTKEKISYQVTLVLVHFISVFVSFITLKFLVFQSKGDFFRQYLKCNLSYLTLLGFNLLALTFLVENLKFHVMLSQVFIVIIMAVTSFIVHEKFSFAARKDASSVKIIK